MSAVDVILLVLALVLLVGNTMIAVAFMRGRRNNLKSSQRGAEDAMEELHRRVQELTARRK